MSNNNLTKFRELNSCDPEGNRCCSTSDIRHATLTRKTLEFMEEERRTDDIDATATDHSCGHRCYRYIS